MAQQTSDQENKELSDTPRPLLPDRQESVHPALHPSLTNVPVTPGFLPHEYDAEGSDHPSETSYFAHDIETVRSAMAHSPTDAASGAKSNRDILRRISLTSGLQRKDSLVDMDPRAANPSLSLSGGIISATFCIPHTLTYRKGADWVSTLFRICEAYLIDILGPR